MVTRTIRFRIDKDENLLSAQLWEMDADGLRERKVRAATLSELPPEWAEAIRAFVQETSALQGEIEIP
jgi:hypothetical protein